MMAPVKMLLACITLLLAGVASENYNFPAKSVNLNAAYQVEFFKAQHMTESPPLGLAPADDAAACTGVELVDGSYLLGGNSIESDGSTIPEGFATKLTATGDMAWAWKSGVSGMDGILSVAQLPNGEVLIVGYRAINGINTRSITKLNADTGAEVWTMTDFGDKTTHGAWEMINIDATHGAVLAGFKEKPDTSEFTFKSGGNTAGGKAVISTMSIASLSASTAPTISDVATTKTYADYHTAHTAHFVSATQVAALLWADQGCCDSGAASCCPKAKMATFAVFNPTSNTDVFTPVEHSVNIGEGTDMKLVGATHAVITGQKTDSENGSGYSGRLTKVSITDGQLVWSKEYSSCGFGSTTAPKDAAPLEGQCSKDIIYNECWGVAVMADGGFVLSCGTGIEGCHAGPLYADCTAGTGDKRPGAYPHFSGVWASLTVKTDSSGTLEWQSVDSYKSPTAPALPTAPRLPMMDFDGTMESTITSSAGEWAIPINNGTGVVIVTDQGQGLGLQKFVGPTSSSATPKKRGWTWLCDCEPAKRYDESTGRIPLSQAEWDGCAKDCEVARGNWAWLCRFDKLNPYPKDVYCADSTSVPTGRKLLMVEETVAKNKALRAIHCH